MRLLTILVAALAMFYGGYWFVGASAVERGGRALLDGLNGTRIEVTYSDLQTTGFPSRFDTTITDVAVTDTYSGLRLNMPFVQLLALSYLPTRAVVVWPDSQTITLPGQTLTFASDGMRASASVQARPDLPLRAITLEANAMRLSSDLGWAFAADHLLAAIRPDPRLVQGYDLYLDVAGLALPDAMKAALDPDQALPPRLGNLTLDTTVVTTAPLDRQVGLSSHPHVASIAFNATEIGWGSMRIVVNGELTADDLGRTNGTLALTITDWRRVIDLSVRMGLIDPGVAPTWIRAGETLSNGGDTLDLPIRVQDGAMSYGFLALGAMPILP